MLLSLKNFSLHLGSTVLLDRADLGIERGERVCLVGRNGTGKSTLLKAIAGELAGDGGEIQRESNLHLAQLPQEVPAELAGTVYEVAAAGLGETGRLAAEYHRLLHERPDDLKAIGRVQEALEARGGWSLDSRVQAVLTRLELPADTAFGDLSGGLKRRTLLAQALVAEPDLLLLDEPTNHLDVESIAWLEEFLLGWTAAQSGTLLFVTHDRAFLRRLATRIVELDRGVLQSWPGSYDDYLHRKEEALRVEEQRNALFDKRLAQEEAWIRKGIEARRTRNQGRVERLYKLREADRARRRLPGQVRLAVQEAERSGKLVAEAEGVSFARGARPIVRNFSTTILRGDKIGIIGPNGAGKTTLLNLLLGRLAPDSGSLRLGTNLQVAYFDQLRAALDEDKPVHENIGEGKDFVEIDGNRRHVMTYLQDFLFTPDRARSPVRALSGGERARLLLARLFAQPSNLLVLDEPTNDLDVETLDLLEERLAEYGGTVLLVSHDREFLDNVVTRCLVFEGGGRIGEYVGGYTDWLRQRPQPPAVKAQPGAAPAARSTQAVPAAKPPKLGYKEQRELAALPGRIEKLEAEQAELTALIGDPAIYQRERPRALAAQARLGAIENELAEAYARWEALEAQR
ncbi:MAG: ATP-binding cassette domain-containing protein [Nevskia sp.]|nr:ATP-binding cassette domain-containing protein [Nevskia sp.]